MAEYRHKDIPTVYSHMKPTYRILHFAHARQEIIKAHIAQLQQEHDLIWQPIIDKFKTDVCPDCYGEGTIMKPIPGCECDGPRMHTCDACNGTGAKS